MAPIYLRTSTECRPVPVSRMSADIMTIWFLYVLLSRSLDSSQVSFSGGQTELE